MNNIIQPRENKSAIGKIRDMLWNKRIYFLVFIIPVFIMFAVYALFKVHPFGPNSVLVLDLNGQYVYYYEAFRDFIHGGDELFYNWSRNLSGEMFGVFAYYLASPFMLIICLLPRAWMCGAIELLQLLKMGAAAAAFAFFLKRTSKPKTLSVIVFSSCYSLMSYMVVQLMNPMWLDGLILLPLICLGVHRLVDEGKLLPLTIPMALMFITHFYIGYMMGIFTFFYFVYYCFTKKRRIFPEHFFKTVAKFALGTVVALLCACIVLIPVYNSLKLGKFEFTEPDFSLATQFDFLTLITKMFPMTYDSVNVEGLPMIYCGTMTVLLIPLFFMNKRIYIKKKVGLGLLSVLLIVSMYIRPSDMVWHGFQMPNWLPFRYSFALSFVFLIMAFEAFENIKGVTVKEIGGVFFGVLVFLFWCERENYSHFQIFETFKRGKGSHTIPQGIWGSIIAISVYFAVLYLVRKKYRISKIFCVSVSIIVCAELTINVMDTVNKVNQEVMYSQYISYEPYMSNTRDAVKQLKDSDNEPFYRMEATFHRTVNDPIGVGYYGVSHSSSTMNSPVLTMLKRLGFSYGGHSTKYTGKTYITDALFDIKYVMDKIDEDGTNSYADRDSAVPKEYEIVKEIQENGALYKFHQNPYALGLGLSADSRIEDIELNDTNPFENQNTLFSALTSKDEITQYFTRIQPYDMQTENMSTAQLSDGHTQYSYKDEEIAECHIDYLVEMDKTSDLYMYLPTKYERSCNVWIQKESEYDNGSTEMEFAGQFFDGDNYAIMNLGEFESGERIRVRISIDNEENVAYWSDNLFYSFDFDTFEQDAVILQQKSWEVTAHEGSYVEGRISANSDDEVLFTTIPQENGWIVKVNGKSVKTSTALDSLITIPLEKGENIVTMEFSPDYLKLSVILSLSGVAAIILIFLFEYKNGKIIKRFQKRETENNALTGGKSE